MNQLDRLKPGTLLKIAHIKRDHLVQIIDKTQQEGLFYVDYYSSNDKDTWIPTKMHLDIMRMPHTIISKRELALEMIAKYYHSPEKCSISSDGSCRYYDKETGNYCIMGMCMKNPEAFDDQLNSISIQYANSPQFREKIELHPIITKIFNLSEVRMLQAVHDTIASHDTLSVDNALNGIFKGYNLLLDPTMQMNCISIQNHIKNNASVWLPFHK